MFFIITVKWKLKFDDVTMGQLYCYTFFTINIKCNIINDPSAWSKDWFDVFFKRSVLYARGGGQTDHPQQTTDHWWDHHTGQPVCEARNHKDSADRWGANGQTRCPWYHWYDMCSRSFICMHTECLISVKLNTKFMDKRLNTDMSKINIYFMLSLIVLLKIMILGLL